MSLTRREFLALGGASIGVVGAAIFSNPRSLQAAVSVSEKVRNTINYNPDNVYIREFDLALSGRFPDKKLPIGARIGVISDLHINNFNSSSIEQLYKLNSLNLDILIIAGDFIPENSNKINEHFGLLDELTSKMHGKIFAVLGNHDYKLDGTNVYDNSDLLSFLKSRGIGLLDNSASELNLKGGKLRLSGVGSVMRGRYMRPSINKSSKNLEILISHEPIGFHLSGDEFELGIAGHVHGCPDWLINIASIKSVFINGTFGFNEFDYRYNNGLYSSNSTTILANSGIGKHGNEKYFTQRNIDILTIS